MNHSTKSLLVGTVGAASLFLAGATSASANTTHQVVNHDTIWDLSQKYGVTVQSIEQLNHINSNDLIFPGQKVQIPGSDAKQAPVKTVAPKETANTSTYSVKAGDSLWTIAQAHNISVAKLQGLNNLSSDLLQPGQTLKVVGTVAAQPVKAAQPTPAAAKPAQQPAAPQAKAVQTPAQPQVAANHVNHSVVSGESLYTIANKYGVSVASIRQANALQSAALTIGQSLVINNPVQKPAAQVQAQAKVQTPAPAAQTQQQPAAQAQPQTNNNNNYRSSNNNAARSYNKPSYQAPAQRSTPAPARQTKINYSSSANTYSWGQCTWYVKSVAGWAGNNWGNGQDWANSARQAGYTVNSTPSVGSIAVFAGGQTVHGVGAGAYDWVAAPGFGHVAYVVGVNGNSVTIQQGGTGFSNPGGPNTQTVSASGVQFIHR